MSIQPSDLVSLSERLLIACDQSYAAESLELGKSHLAPDFGDSLGTSFLPPYSFDYPGYIVQNRVVNDDTGFDAAADVIARAVASAAPGTPIEATAPVVAIEVRDLLDDVDAVLGQERVRLADLPALLRDLAPAWGPYRALTGVQLREQLEGAGVRTTNVGNVPRLDPADLRRVLAGGQDSEVS